MPSHFLHQDVAGAEDASEDADRFGWALAIADFGWSAQEDLAVGIPREAVTYNANGAQA